MHNDSTSISVHGVYSDAVGTARGGQSTPVITWGHRKDHRPDLKQLIWILTVSADGAVPIAYRLAEGNTSDDPTHVPTWDGLVGLLGRTDFLYVADSRLCSRKAMGHIACNHGRFVTVMPRTRAEDGTFGKHLQTHAPVWTQAIRRPGKHLGDPDEIYSTTPAPLPSAQGYRTVWTHSTAKASRDAQTRSRRIDAGNRRDRGPGGKARWTAEPVQDPRRHRTSRSRSPRRHRRRPVGQRHRQRDDFQELRASPCRPRPNTNDREVTKTRFTVSCDIWLDVIRYDAVSDGCFPVISNDHALSDAEVLAAYRYQPSLERRHHLLKSIQDAAPVLLHSPTRIEALFCRQFLALLISALIEREVRTGMHHADLTNIRLYPEFWNCTSPSTERILEIFATLSRHQLHHDGVLIKTFHPELTAQQQQVLDLMNLTPGLYRQLT